MKRLSHAFVCLIALAGLTSCIDVVTPYSIGYPVNGASYVGTEYEPAKNDDGTYNKLDTTFIVNYDTAPSGQLKIILNGYDIGSTDYFTYGPDKAVVDINKIKHHFKQGRNTLSVEPLSFGPQIVFNLDTAGPLVVVTNGDVTYADREVTAYNPQGVVSGTKTIKEPASVVIKGFVRDSSAVGTTVMLELEKITGHKPNGKIIRVPHSQHIININPDRTFESESINISGIIEEVVWFDHDKSYRTPQVIATNSQYYDNTLPQQLVDKGGEITKKVSLLYKFKSIDTNGYESTREYLADSEHAGTLGIDNAVRAAVGGSVIQSMRPIIAAGLASAMEAAPIHAKCSQVGPHADPRLRKPGEYYDHNNESTAAGNEYAVAVAPESCRYWDNDRICNGVSGVYPEQNITQADFDTQDLADGSGDGKVENREIDDAFYACTDGLQDGSRSGGGPMYLPIELLGMTIKFDAFLREMILLNGSEEVSLGGKKYKEIGDVVLKGKHGTMLLNGFSIKENNTLNVDMEITHMAAGITMAGTAPLGEAITIDIALYIGGVSVDADAIVSAKGKKVDVALDPNNTNIAMQNIKLTEMKACMETWDPLNIIPPICVTIPPALINPIINPIMGLVGGMIPGIANPIIAANLQKITISESISGLQKGTEFEMGMNVAELGTEAAATDFDLVAGLESVANITIADPLVNHALGPIFKEDPIDLDDVLNGAGGGGNSNLSVAISGNLINQALAAAYATGSTHMTIHNGKTYFGADPLTPGNPETMTDPDKAYLEDLDGDGQNRYTETLAAIGDRRIRLWPDTPPTISFSEVVGSAGAGLALVKYESATAYVDDLIDDNGTPTWKTMMSAKVDFDLGVTIDEKDGAFTMGSAGAPKLNINEDALVNHTNIQIASSILQVAVDLVLGAGGNFLADQFLVLDLNKISEAALNKDVKFRSTQDLYTQPVGDETDCIVYKYDDDGQATDEVEEARGAATLGADGISDIVCHKVNFDIFTNNVGVTGSKGSNLLFQMLAIDSRFKKPRGLPRLDLDDDQSVGQFDYQDNCSVNRYYLSKAVELVKRVNGVSELVKEDGALIDVGDDTVDDQIKTVVNLMLAAENVEGFSFDPEDPTLKKFMDVDALSDTAPDPTGVDIANWNTKRVGDTLLDDLASLGSYPWITMMYSNKNQYNSNGNDEENPDRVGELCESDIDFDGIWDDNAGEVDNCPGISNYNQFDGDNNGVGDACDIRSNFVLIRSLGSRYPNDPNVAVGSGYKCLTHSAYKTTTFDFNGVSVSSDMDNDDTDKDGTGKTMAACDSDDVNQRWYLQQVNEGDDPAGVSYRFYADVGRNNENSWQLGAWFNNVNDGNMRMARFNDASKTIGAKGDERIGGLWELHRYVSFTGDDGTSAGDKTDLTLDELEQLSHPWIISPRIAYDAGRPDCLFYNTDGFGPDFDKNTCIPKAQSSSLDSASRHKNISNDKFYRWGIYIQGDQLWNGVW